MTYTKGKRAKVSTHGELDDAIKAGAFPIIITASPPGERLVAWGSAHVEARGSAHVVARESAHVVAGGSAHVVAGGSAHVVAWGSAHVEAWGSAHVVAWESAHVEAWGSAHVEAWGSAHVVAGGSAHVVAWGSAYVEAGGSAYVEAGSYVSVHKMLRHIGEIVGGVVVEEPLIESAEAWCEYSGVQVVDGVAILYKGVGDDYKSAHRVFYLPGTIPAADDWDGGESECGGGLHFCARPAATCAYCSPTRYVACPVALEDMRAPRSTDSMRSKIKARGCCAPIWEVDLGGQPVDTEGGS